MIYLDLKHNVTEQDMQGLKVFVYFNLHKKVFSVKAMEGINKGLVIAHTNNIELLNVAFKVSQAGRNRVLLEKKKNVHAGVVGAFKSFEQVNTSELKTAYYNPYKTKTFLDGDQALHTADYAVLDNRSVFFQ
jgi:hypothetical protein